MAQEMMDLATFCAHAMALCDEHECSVTSWRRTTRHNLAVGGKPTSKHLTGLGCDLVPDEMTQARRAGIVASAHARGLAALDEGDHVHIQVRSDP